LVVTPSLCADEVRLSVEESLQAVADHGVVVHNEHPDHPTSSAGHGLETDPSQG